MLTSGIENNIHPQERVIYSVNLILIRKWVAASWPKAVCHSTGEKGQLNNLYSKTVGLMTFSIMNSTKTKVALSDRPEVIERPGNICADWSCLAQKAINKTKARFFFFFKIIAVISDIMPIIHSVVVICTDPLSIMRYHSRLVSHNAECYVSREQNKTSLIKNKDFLFFPPRMLSPSPSIHDISCK